MRDPQAVQPFDRRDFERAGAAGARMLNRGRWGNADVTLIERPDGQWVVKDFRPRPWLVRATFGRYMVWREWLALSRLDGLPGIPGGAFRVDPYAMACRYLPSSTLRGSKPEQTGPVFFRKLERLVRQMHRRGVAHLDLRYRRNILILENGDPGIIDFQSHVQLRGLPLRLQRFLRRVDYSGVYKQWCKRSPDTLGLRRLTILGGSNRLRKWWIVRGYGFKIKKRNWRAYEQVARRRRATT